MAVLPHNRMSEEDYRRVIPAVKTSGWFKGESIHCVSHPLLDKQARISVLFST